MKTREILRDAGLPEDYVVLDFESYFDQEYSLTKMTTLEYINDPQFELTGLGAFFSDEAAGTFTPPSLIDAFFNAIDIAYGEDWENITVVMHNARFDASILAYRFGRYPKHIIDTRDLSRFIDSRISHSLKDLAVRYLKDEVKGNTMQFKGKHFADLTVEELCNFMDYTIQDVVLERKLFELLLPYIAPNLEFEAKLMQHTLELFTRPEFDFDEPHANELSAKMEKKLQDLLDGVGCTKEQISKNKSFISLLQEALGDEPIPMKAGKNKPIPALAKDDEEFKNLLIHPNERVAKLAEVRSSIKSWPLHIARVQRMITHARACRGKFPVPLNYYGCHTGRWSGAEKLNLQNLGSRGNPLISEVRNLLLASELCTLDIVDAAQIEARVLSYFAGQDDLVAEFRLGMDVYCSFAKGIFNSNVRKPKNCDPSPVAKLLKTRRALGKQGILGCGYGMGPKTFFERLKADPELLPLIKSGEITIRTAKEIVRTYRKKYAKITKFWADIEKAFRWVALHDDVVRLSGMVFSVLPDKKHLIGKYGKVVVVELPSGRRLFYPEVRIHPTSRAISWRYGSLHGGPLTENVVQAASRDILAETILSLNENSLKTVLHCHDEVVIMAVRENADVVGQAVVERLSVPPVWGRNIPLASELTISECYTK